MRVSAISVYGFLLFARTAPWATTSNDMPDADSIYAALRSAITDSSADSGTDGPTSFDKGKVAGFIVGADEVAEATVEAYRKLGISPVFMMARESRPL